MMMLIAELCTVLKQRERYATVGGWLISLH